LFWYYWKFWHFIIGTSHTLRVYIKTKLRICCM